LLVTGDEIAQVLVCESDTCEIYLSINWNRSLFLSSISNRSNRSLPGVASSSGVLFDSHGELVLADGEDLSDSRVLIEFNKVSFSLRKGIGPYDDCEFLLVCGSISGTGLFEVLAAIVFGSLECSELVSLPFILEGINLRDTIVFRIFESGPCGPWVCVFGGVISSFLWISFGPFSDSELLQFVETDEPVHHVAGVEGNTVGLLKWLAYAMLDIEIKDLTLWTVDDWAVSSFDLDRDFVSFSAILGRRESQVFLAEGILVKRLEMPLLVASLEFA
jgi:hypothetical protein